MRLSSVRCDGCGRIPNLREWIRGELSDKGYPEWRHPGIAFRAAGCPMTHENRGKCERLFLALFGRALPEEASFLCPQCQLLVVEELPALAAADTGDELRATLRYYLGQ